MVTPATPTASAPPLTTDNLTVIVASICSLVFLLVVLMLLAILYRRDPLCCKARHNPETQPYPDAPPYYSSRQTLVGSPYQEQPVEAAPDSSAQRPEQLFVVGLPNTYRLPALELPLPRLPSYDSVRKRDRQRYIHMLIAHRFGLYASTLTEPPPTYEESIRQSVEVNWENLEHADTNLPATLPHSHSLSVSRN
ncbi:uncharacterized protein LOC125717361 isoform X2 [Brienomyrus brachyistius]|uniref:uncharacterized protein LOC125717361 isoform X2 n=1 Tax=Brienomyrus brachyistius TaxID=42636 RepID=UPI0020B37E65|nr:uncharacterized protein LOC125717361 isoform X2 [Brienomyrus brachyistius]